MSSVTLYQTLRVPLFSSELDLCKEKDCRAGRECVIIKGVAECHCVKLCPMHAHRVCGSDEVTYHNYCELHKTACVEGRHIRANYKGPCKGERISTYIYP